jgi:hypothetical protein
MSEMLRRSALALHALHSSDREWMLSRLDARERASIEPLLAELRELGIPAIGLDVAMPAEEKREDSPACARDVLHGAKPARMARLLRTEPDPIVVRLLAVEDWPWRGEVIRGMPRSRRRRIEAGIAAVKAEGRGASLAAALVESAARRMAPAREGNSLARRVIDRARESAHAFVRAASGWNRTSP